LVLREKAFRQGLKEGRQGKAEKIRLDYSLVSSKGGSSNARVGARCWESQKKPVMSVPTSEGRFFDRFNVLETFQKTRKQRAFDFEFGA